MTSFLKENFPPYARTTSSIYTFLSSLLASESGSSPDGLAPIQRIEFPPHRDDPPDGPPPIKSKGFAFIILAHAKHVDHLLQQWPWETSKRPAPSSSGLSKPGLLRKRGEEEERSKAVVDALDFGLRCLSKKEWERMKERYLALQRRLLDETLQADRRFHNESISEQMQALAHQKIGKQENGGQVPSFLDSPAVTTATTNLNVVEKHETFPTGCLVFVKNVNPETNKTTLRALFSSAITNNTDAVDYVDYNKGLDSVSERIQHYTVSFFFHFSCHHRHVRLLYMSMSANVEPV